ncbi:MAG: hypothetical protein U0457_17850 [Candidatus Sericytochromatia bacterium]
MTIHDFDKNKLPDSEYYQGDLKFLVEGNICRVLDNRRTPGFIEKIDPESAIFRFRITKFEDNGKYWELPLENITSFQFEKKSKTINNEEINFFSKKINEKNKYLIIKPQEKDLINTNNLISSKKDEIIVWLKNNYTFFSDNKTINIKKHYKILSKALIKYLKEKDLYNLEELTTKILVLNPSSGEWIKGMEICLSELGLIKFNDKAPRTKDIFEKLGAKDLRKKYLIHRMAFIQAYFTLSNFKEIPVYRGMSSTEDWYSYPRTFISYSTDLKVAKSFFSLKDEYKNAYLIKKTIPIEKIFMTFIETKEMNLQYKEKEVLVFYDENKDKF